MEAFRALEPRLHLTSGDFRILNPQSRLILNHSIAGDLNFRVFETLGCGMPLLSPRPWTSLLMSEWYNGVRGPCL